MSLGFLLHSISLLDMGDIPVIFQVASLLAALAHSGNIVTMLPGIHSLAVAIHLEIHRVYLNLFYLDIRENLLANNTLSEIFDDAKTPCFLNGFVSNLMCSHFQWLHCIR